MPDSILAGHWRLVQEIAELKRQNLLLQGGMDYLEKNKIPWLEREIERLRNVRR